MSEGKKTRLTSQRIANAFPRSRLDERRISQICVKAGVMNLKGEGYEFLPAVDAIIGHYKTAYESHDESGREDRARKNKAEADSAELDALTAAGKTCLLFDATLYVSETRIAIRQAIEREPGISDAAKKKLLAKLGAIRIPLPDKE